MKKLVKEFIEATIELIEYEEYDRLYDQAYDWLRDEEIDELTAVLSQTLQDDFSQYAKQNIIKHFNTEINNFVADNRRDIPLRSFVGLYMNSVNGIDWDEFQLLAEKELKDSNIVEVYDDGMGSLYISAKR